MLISPHRFSHALNAFRCDLAFNNNNIRIFSGEDVANRRDDPMLIFYITLSSLPGCNFIIFASLGSPEATPLLPYHAPRTLPVTF